jgi:hypothetical protein
VLKAIVSERVAAGFVDKYLAEHGFDSQQTDEPVAADRVDNLFEALPGDHGAHGSFDNRSSSFSLELWLSKHRGALLAGAGLALLGAGLGYRMARGSSAGFVY